jgi:hypothetical protein
MFKIKKWNREALIGNIIIMSIPLIGAIIFFYFGSQNSDNEEFFLFSILTGLFYISIVIIGLYITRYEINRNYLDIIYEEIDVNQLEKFELIIIETIQNSLYSFDQNIIKKENARLKHITSGGTEWTLSESNISIYYQVWSEKRIKLCMYPSNHENAKIIKQKLYDDLKNVIDRF